MLGVAAVDLSSCRCRPAVTERLAVDDRFACAPRPGVPAPYPELARRSSRRRRTIGSSVSTEPSLRSARFQLGRRSAVGIGSAVSAGCVAPECRCGPWVPGGRRSWTGRGDCGADPFGRPTGLDSNLLPDPATCATAANGREFLADGSPCSAPLPFVGRVRLRHGPRSGSSRRRGRASSIIVCTKWVASSGPRNGARHR
jgi:hypothetical protein